MHEECATARVKEARNRRLDIVCSGAIRRLLQCLAIMGGLAKTWTRRLSNLFQEGSVFLREAAQTASQFYRVTFAHP
jgi:hypothetical protein